MYAVECLLAVVVELEQFIGGSQHLRPRVDHLEKIRPHLVDGVFPLGDHRCVRVSGRDEVVARFVDNCDALLYEEFEHITDIVAQLPPIFERFYASEANRTCAYCGTVKAAKS